MSKALTLAEGPAKLNQSTSQLLASSLSHELAKSESGGTLPANWAVPKSVPAELKAAAIDALAAHEAAQVPASSDFVAACIGQVAMVFPGARSPDELKVIIKTFVADLAEFPADVIIESVRQHRRSRNFFPTVAEIYGPAKEMMQMRESEMRRLRQLINTPTHGELAEAERRLAEKKEAEARAFAAAHPHHAIFSKYRGRGLLQFRSLSEWLKWLGEARQRYSIALIDEWHAKLENICPADPLTALEEMAQRHDEASVVNAA